MELCSIPAKSEMMQHIGVNISNLPEVDGFVYTVACINYCRKWSESKPVKNKSAPTLAQFLYGTIYQSGCMKTQINDRGKDFVNKFSNSLHSMTGTVYRLLHLMTPNSTVYVNAIYY